MDTLIRTLAVLTLLWGGWMYLKSSDADAELRRIRNELKLARQELVNAQATYEAEDKKRETLAGEVATLKEGSQELRKAIATKKEEKRQRSAQERQERLEEERKAQIKEEEERRETDMALLEREKQLEREEEEREKAAQAEIDAKLDAENAERIKALAIKRARGTVLDLQKKIDILLRAQDRYITYSPPSNSSDYRMRLKNDQGRMERIGRNWTLYIRQGAEAVRNGDQGKFETLGKKLLNVARSINVLLPEETTYIDVATNFIDDGREIFKLKKQLKQLKKEITES